MKPEHANVNTYNQGTVQGIHVVAKPVGPMCNLKFVWQGGEPTLLGIDFFKRVIELQKPFAHQKTITNSLQTNGTLLNDEWCNFLKRHNFMVGLSLDGPKEIHDRSLYPCRTMRKVGRD